jgi:hypothetical protein
MRIVFSDPSISQAGTGTITPSVIWPFLRWMSCLYPNGSTCSRLNAG